MDAAADTFTGQKIRLHPGIEIFHGGSGMARVP